MIHISNSSFTAYYCLLLSLLILSSYTVGLLTRLSCRKSLRYISEANCGGVA